jgi:hypothetical protein
MSQVEPLGRTVMLAFDDQKPTLRTDALLLGGVVAMVAGTLAILELADLLGGGALRYGAIAWCAVILAGGRFVMTSSRFTKTVGYRLTLRPDELDIERRSPDALAGSTRIPRGFASLRHRAENEGGAVWFCEVRDGSGQLLFRARDREVADQLSSERRSLGDWLAAWFAPGPTA